ncbi:MAG: calcium/sodium antiporter [Lachnospiraceae bacterium]|nr:calcium/sodium antiporter [Lachnospiraceae bacterium]
MEIMVQFLLLAVGFLMLVKGADWFVDGASGIAEKFGISQLIIGLTIVAMGTSAPEAAVSITAALKGTADITVGNIIGSNILNILLILGCCAVIVPIVVKTSTIRYEIPFMIEVTILLLILGIDGVISCIDGMILWGVFLLYLIYLLYMSRNGQTEDNIKKNQPWWNLILLLCMGLIMIIMGSGIAVDAATAIAEIVGLSEKFIGLTIVALGTSLPELFTSVSAARKGNADIAIGNIIGSNIFNILFVIGTSSLVTPILFRESFQFDIFVAIAAAVLLLISCLKKYKIGRMAGIIMLVSYAVYFVYLC